MAEVAFDPSGLLLDAAQGADGGTGQGDLVSGRSGLGHVPFQISVEQVVRIQFRRVAGQVDNLDLVCIFGSAQESVKQRDFRGICLRAGIGYSSADARQRLDTGIGLAWVQGLPA